MEGTEGTLTFHLPFTRGAEISPQATLVVRRMTEGSWHAGLSVCSLSDQFVKKRGRRLAVARLHGRPFIAGSPSELVRKIESHLNNLVHNRPYTLSMDTLDNLYALVERLGNMRVE